MTLPSNHESAVAIAIRSQTSTSQTTSKRVASALAGCSGVGGQCDFGLGRRGSSIRDERSGPGS